MVGRSKNQNVLILATLKLNHLCPELFKISGSKTYRVHNLLGDISESQKLNKLKHFAHIISESSTSMDPDIADVVHKHLWEII